MNFAVIVCTYNPERLILERCLRAVTQLKIPFNSSIEVIIVDNNSTLPIRNLEYVQNIINKTTWCRIIEEERQGLSFARIAGVQSTSAAWIIFFDDDNEPEEDYLLNLLPLIKNYPKVAVWGAGTIEVKFIGNIPMWVKQWKHVFQQRTFNKVFTGNEKHWQEYYPLGTGLVAIKQVMNFYIQLFNQGEITTKDRTGKSLSSAGDIQIGFLAIKKGYEVGTSPNLKINHLTPSRKASYNYIKRLHFGTASAYQRAFTEIYPEELKNVRLTSFKQFRQKIQLFLLHKLKIWGVRRTIFEMASFSGDVAGQYYAHNRPEPKWLSTFIQIMKFR